MRTAVALYARISQDRSGDGLGVQRQPKDCRAEAERRGWLVAEEYVDDDLSGYSGKTRPAYRRMLDQIRDRERDAVIVWHIDRLTRRPIELEKFVQACAVGGVSDVVTLNGDMNLSSGDGMLMARIMAAGAAWESDATSRRSRRKMLELAEAGKPHGGGVRPFGFNDDRLTLNEAEAEVIAQIVARFLAGEHRQPREVAQRARCTDRDRQRVAQPNRPQPPDESPHRRTSRGKAQWPAIVTPEQHAQVVAILQDPARRTNRSARR